MCLYVDMTRYVYKSNLQPAVRRHVHVQHRGKPQSHLAQTPSARQERKTARGRDFWWLQPRNAMKDYKNGRP